jgi:hypothetical protein
MLRWIKNIAFCFLLFGFPDFLPMTFKLLSLHSSGLAGMKWRNYMPAHTKGAWVAAGDKSLGIHSSFSLL